MAQRAGTERAASDATAGVGHNRGPLTPEERGVLLIHHMTKLRERKKRVDAAKVRFDEEKAELNSLFALAKADKFPRKRLAGYLEEWGSGAGILAQQREQNEVAFERSILGLPIPQPAGDLFNTADEKPNEVDTDNMADVWRWFGFQAGLQSRGSEYIDEVPAEHHQSAEAGYRDGADRVTKARKQGPKIQARRAAEEKDDGEGGD